MQLNQRILSDLIIHMKYARYLPELQRRKAPGPEPLKICIAHLSAILDRKADGYGTVTATTSIILEEDCNRSSTAVS